MKKTALFIIGSFLALSASAEWQFVTQSDGHVDFYIENSGVKAGKSIRKVWLLLDRLTPDKNGSLSTRALYEFDCDQKKGRTLQSETFKYRTARGEISAINSSSSDWRYIPTDSVINDVLVAVCAPSQLKPNK